MAAKITLVTRIDDVLMRYQGEGELTSAVFRPRTFGTHLLTIVMDCCSIFFTRLRVSVSSRTVQAGRAVQAGICLRFRFHLVVNSSR